jgi:hypothetical protein
MFLVKSILQHYTISKLTTKKQKKNRLYSLFRFSCWLLPMKQMPSLKRKVLDLLFCSPSGYETSALENQCYPLEINLDCYRSVNGDYNMLDDIKEEPRVLLMHPTCFFTRTFYLICLWSIVEILVQTMGDVMLQVW